MAVTVENLLEALQRFPQGATVAGPLDQLQIVTKHSYDGVCHYPVGMPDADIPDWSKPDARPRGAKGKLPTGYVRIDVNYGHDGLAAVAFGKLSKNYPGWSVDQLDNLLEITAPGTEVYQWVLTETDMLPTDYPALAPFASKVTQYRCRHCGLVDTRAETHCGSSMEEITS